MTDLTPEATAFVDVLRTVTGADALTAREAAILHASVALGLGPRAASFRLDIAESTVGAYLTHIVDKLGFASAQEMRHVLTVAYGRALERQERAQ
jgi:DNA-binding NarL/FixJ family response regulator